MVLIKCHLNVGCSDAPNTIITHTPQTSLTVLRCSASHNLSTIIFVLTAARATATPSLDDSRAFVFIGYRGHPWLQTSKRTQFGSVWKDHMISHCLFFFFHSTLFGPMPFLSSPSPNLNLRIHIRTMLVWFDFWFETCRRSGTPSNKFITHVYVMRSARRRNKKKKLRKARHREMGLESSDRPVLNWLTLFFRFDFIAA